MTTQTAIIQLKNRAEIALARAGTSKQLSEANELTNICNTIIDFYNQTEHLQARLKNAQEMIQVIGECYGIAESDIDTLKTADADFIRRRLLFRSYLAGASDWLIWYYVASDYRLLKTIEEDIVQNKQFISLLNTIQLDNKYDYINALELDNLQLQEMIQSM